MVVDPLRDNEDVDRVVVSIGDGIFFGDWVVKHIWSREESRREIDPRLRIGQWSACGATAPKRNNQNLYQTSKGLSQMFNDMSRERFSSLLRV